MSERDRDSREIKTVIDELSRHDELDDYLSPASDREAAGIGHLLADSVTLSDSDVDALWDRGVPDTELQAEDAQSEVAQVLQSSASQRPGLGQPEDDV